MFGIISVWQQLAEKDVMIMGEVDNENGKCESVKYQARVSSEILSGKHTWAVVFPDLLISNHKEIPKKSRELCNLCRLCLLYSQIPYVHF